MSEFVRTGNDVSELPQVPDVAFDVTPVLIIAAVDGFTVRIAPTASGAKCRVEIDLDGAPYMRCEYIPTQHPSFAEEDITHEVTGFACGILWSAWRRRELDKNAPKAASPGPTGEKQ